MLSLNWRGFETEVDNITNYSL
ncbi:unnamed protein product [Acanthoscelides obtectus]|uniref:Uncharacterized protein n=1 Tax=Acanthoscelides obtectus TaxID=200917 RepID=A0A9P0PGW5_ACAOB|nr:unnamed protein product [Acanthoscelides obtectus]CAK1643209.1 hypothetical protein AOBTE_LOCUS13447 [Acanthoscelides obtectus]